MVAFDVLVRVPVPPRKTVVRAAPDLHEAHAALQKPAGDQAVAAEVLRDLLVETVEPAHRRRFAGDIEDFRSARLQARCQFVAGDAGLEAGIARPRLFMAAIEAAQQLQTLRLAPGRDE